MTRSRLSLTISPRGLRVEHVVETYSDRPPAPVNTTGESASPITLRPLAKCLPALPAVRVAGGRGR